LLIRQDPGLAGSRFQIMIKILLRETLSEHGRVPQFICIKMLMYKDHIVKWM